VSSPVRGRRKNPSARGIAHAIASRGWFVIVDMTDVRDFWETLLQGFLESLPTGDQR